MFKKEYFFSRINTLSKSKYKNLRLFQKCPTLRAIGTIFLIRIDVTARLRKDLDTKFSKKTLIQLLNTGFEGKKSIRRAFLLMIISPPNMSEYATTWSHFIRISLQTPVHLEPPLAHIEHMIFVNSKIEGRNFSKYPIIHD